MNSSRTPKRRIGPQLAIGLVTASVLSVGLAVPAYAVGVNAITVAPAFINLANQGAVVISGTAESTVTEVLLGLDDGTAAAIFEITANLSPIDASGGKPWSATVPASALSDGLVTIFAAFDPASCDPATATCDASKSATKDTIAPDAPTAFPDGVDLLPGPTNIFIESLNQQPRTHFTFGPAPIANPTVGSTLVSPDPALPSHTVSTNQQVKAIAFDLAGNASPILTVDYTFDTPAPPAEATVTTTALTVSPTSPQDSGTPVTLTASVSPAGTAGTFEFFNGTTSLGAAAAATTKTLTPAVGTHSYTAKFIPDNAASFTTSMSPATSYTVTAVVVTPPPTGGGGGGGTPPPAGGGGTPPPAGGGGTPPATPEIVTAPEVIARTPAVNATGITRTSNITAKFSKNVTGVNSRSFTLRTKAGTAVAAAVSYNSTTRMATLNPTRTLLADTAYVATLSSAITAGKALAVTRWSFTTGARPTIIARTPGVNARDVARVANVSIKFNERVSGVSGSSLMLVTSSGRRVAAVVNDNRFTRMATLNPTSRLAAGTRYTVVVGSAIKDAAGNQFAVTRWSFTTGR